MEYVKLKGLVDLKQGMAINSKSNHLVVDHETSLPLLRIADMPTKRKVIFMDESTPERFWADENDIIYTRTGQVGLVFRGQKGVVHNNCFRVIPFDEKVLDRNYLYWVLTLKSIYNYANSIAAGAAQPDLPHDSFKTIQIPFFDIEVQRKIVNILDCFDKAIENNNKRIKILEQMAENLYKEWFVRYRFPGHEGVEFEDGIPKGWKIMRIGEVSRLINGRAYLMPELQDEGKYRIVRVGNFSGKNEWFFSDMELDEDKYCSKGDLLYKWACNFGPEIWDEEKVIFHYHIWKIIPNEMVNREYLYHFLEYSTPLWLGGTNGATMVHITKESMEKKKIIVPSKKIVDRFGEMVVEINHNIWVLKEQKKNLEKQRDLLLPRLMSGKLEIK